MAQPPKYSRVKNFADDFGHETDHSSLNAELDKASNSINDIRFNLAILQADDGRLRPDVVTYDSLSKQMLKDISEDVRADVQDELDRAEAAAVKSESEANRSEIAADGIEQKLTLASESAFLAENNAAFSTKEAENAAASAQEAASSSQQASESMVLAVGSAASAAQSAIIATTGAYVTDAGGSADEMEAIFNQPLSDLCGYLTVLVRSKYSNTSSAPTLKVNAFTAKKIVKGGNLPLLPGDISGQVCQFHFNDALDKWELQNPARGVAIQFPVPPDGYVVGDIKMWPSATLPSGGKWMVRKGDILAIEDYPELFAVVGTTFGGNGTTTFALPDDRGLVERGLDLGRGYDSDRAIGSEQMDMLKAHTHTSPNIWLRGDGGTIGPSLSGGSRSYQWMNLSTEGGQETRMKNRAYLPIIKVLP